MFAIVIAMPGVAYWRWHVNPILVCFVAYLTITPHDRQTTIT